MGDVLIRGMKMPKSCYKCVYLHWSNFFQKYICCAILGEGDFVLINGNEVKSDSIIESGRSGRQWLNGYISYGEFVKKLSF